MAIEQYFTWDERLGISLPQLAKDWSEYEEAERELILDRWEQIRGSIPDRIKSIERMIEHKQHQLGLEHDFPASCRLNSEIAELASMINDLQIWYRVQQDVEPVHAHH